MTPLAYARQVSVCVGACPMRCYGDGLVDKRRGKGGGEKDAASKLETKGLNKLEQAD